MIKSLAATASGWPAVFMIMAAELVMAVMCVRAASERWWHAIWIALVALAADVAFFHVATARLFEYVPNGVFSGTDDKEQFIYLNIMTEMFLSFVVPAVIVIGLKNLRGEEMPNDGIGGRQD